MNRNCNNCEYLSKRAGVGPYFIYKCSYWGLVCERVLPQSVVMSSIGKPCPFFKEKTRRQHSTDDKDKNDNNGNDDNKLDIII